MYHIQPPMGTQVTGLDVKIADSGTQRVVSLRQPDAALGRVVENRLLTKGAIQDKRHIGAPFSLQNTYKPFF
jgi:hypothetical protein